MGEQSCGDELSRGGAILRCLAKFPVAIPRARSDPRRGRIVTVPRDVPRGGNAMGEVFTVATN